eukprot:CAMPEP_0178953146 /NCGR_PEP_ID=MMETSP0789-20121207/8253_1 /TAXON_ID=3005 /ORGANISM="Rhizosolenia setigera, Strain CCMP 1694" /LENGTH=296 /DNA_ID=CAMNT_0020634365 /DNA_START=30 /DNA_END=920 /DNA_ORIENTATION=-
MESSSSKRRRLMMSYVPRRPDLPAIFESLNDDTLTTVLGFVGNKSYAVYAMINKHCKEIYLSSGMTKETFLYGYAPLSVIIDKIEGGEQIDPELRVGKGVVSYNRRDVFQWALGERNNDLLWGICVVAAEEGRTDILEEVFNGVGDWNDKRYVFLDVDNSAAGHDKLNVLKWLKDKRLFIDTYDCASEATANGHLQILEWLKEEKGLKLNEQLYNYAIQGGHLHVMKWLSEQRVDWEEFTFPCAAKKGNLEVLQWLHDEGCPWPEDPRHRVYEHLLEPDVIEWLRTNGFDDRIQLQ